MTGLHCVPVPPGCHHCWSHQCFCQSFHPAEWTVQPGPFPGRQPLHPATHWNANVHRFLEVKYHLPGCTSDLMKQSHLSKVKFLIWVRQARELSWATIQVDIARTKSWEKANFGRFHALCSTHREFKSQFFINIFFWNPWLFSKL